MAVKIYKCKRCGHSWANRKNKEPRMCPNVKCHSLCWDEPRKRK